MQSAEPAHRNLRLRVTKGLSHPWAMAFLPDGAILITDRYSVVELPEDVIDAVVKTFAGLAGLVFMLLMIAQFIAVFNYSQMPAVIATMLSQALANTAAGRGCAVILAGAGGIGKTRLAAELVSALGPEITALYGRCVSYGEGATYLPVTEIVRSPCGFATDCPARPSAAASAGARSARGCSSRSRARSSSRSACRSPRSAPAAYPPRAARSRR